MYIGLHVLYSTRYSCPILMKLEFSRQFFLKIYSNIRFHWNPSSGSQIVLCGETDAWTLFVTVRKRLKSSSREHNRRWSS